jgi:flagellar motor component MotA
MTNQLIPEEQYVSYRSFCNHYYRIVETVILLNEKARREGFLSLEDDLKTFNDDFFSQGIRLVIDGTDPEIIRRILTLKIEHEHNFYRKKLLEIALDGILCIQHGFSMITTACMLASLVDIKNNPLDTACAEYFGGNCKAFKNIDFKSAVLPEEECEEVRFIKRAIFLSKTASEEGILALEKHLDRDSIAKKDVFEYGLPLVIDYSHISTIEYILTILVDHETNPVQENLALAKKEAIMSICSKENTRIMILKLLSYFDKNIERMVSDELG